jgi:hypothetical protein
MSTAIYIGCGWDTSPFLWDDIKNYIYVDALNMMTVNMMKTVKRIMIMKNNH